MSISTKDFMAKRAPHPHDIRRAALLRHNYQAILSDWQFATLKWYNMARGFGFVTLANGAEAFMHATVFRAAGFIRYVEGMPLDVRVYSAGSRIRVGDVREAKNG